MDVTFFSTCSLALHHHSFIWQDQINTSNKHTADCDDKFNCRVKQKTKKKQQHEALCSHHFIDVNWSKSAFLSSPSSCSLVSLRTTCSHCTGLTPLSLDTLGYLRQRWCRIVSVKSDCVTSYFLKLAFSLSLSFLFFLSLWKKFVISLMS